MEPEEEEEGEEGDAEDAEEKMVKGEAEKKIAEAYQAYGISPTLLFTNPFA